MLLTIIDSENMFLEYLSLWYIDATSSCKLDQNETSIG